MIWACRRPRWNKSGFAEKVLDMPGGSSTNGSSSSGAGPGPLVKLGLPGVVQGMASGPAASNSSKVLNPALGAAEEAIGSGGSLSGSC
eukprot:917705-Pyramimonas_sp.AAC.1